MTTEKTVVAEPVAMLEARIMDPTVPKNRAEHWAAREIEKLRAEVKGLTRELAEARVENGQLRDALIEWDGLIEHQYSGSRDAMSDMQYAALRTAQLLDDLDIKEGGR